MMDNPDDLNLDQDVHPGHRSGFVAVVGKPNVGKSTLMNFLLKEKLAIVSPKPQTTRARQLGILTLPHAQIIFVDTPGIHEARTKLGRYMVDVAAEAIPNADLVLFLGDISEPADGADRAIAELIVRKVQVPVIVALNKCDLVSPEIAQARISEFGAIVPGARVIAVSAATGERLGDLLALLIESLPPGPRFYPADQLTETHLRDNAAEIIREKILMLFEEEIPHSVAVQVDEFKERSDRLTYIAATIYVEKDSQKGILIGKKGQMLKRIGEVSRPELEELLGTSVYLELWVKVLKNWRRDERALRRLGYYHKP